MKLQSEKWLALMIHCPDRGILCRRAKYEPRRKFSDSVTVAHPNVKFIAKPR